MHGTNVKISRLHCVALRYVCKTVPAVFASTKHLNRLGIVNGQQEEHCHTLLLKRQSRKVKLYL